MAGFEQPRYLHVEAPLANHDRPPAASELIRGQALIGRSVLAVVLVAAGPILARAPEVVSRFGWLVALVWLPGVGMLDLGQRRWHAPYVALASLMWDVALFATADAVLHVPATAAVGYLLVTAYHAYVGGPRWAVAAAVVCAGATVAVPLATDQPIDGHLLGVQTVGLALLAWLLGDASRRHDTSRAGLVRVSEKSAAIVAGIVDAVVVMTPDGRVQEWNPAASRAFGCPPEQSQGRRCDDVLGLHLGLRPLLCDERCALLAEATAGQSVEVWRRDATGRRQPLLSSASAILDGHGRPVEVIHSFRDISAMKAADEAKTMFLATASHELKTPLTVIHGFAQMLQRGEMAGPQREHALHAIEVRSQQLAGIVDRLLMSSRIDAGRIDLSTQPMDVSSLVRDRAAAFEAATGRVVSVDAAIDVPFASADRDAITTVLDHLLDNASKYSNAEGMIRVALAPGQDGTMVLTVADDGIGMTPEQIERCFDRFWQAESTDVRRFGGTGIGLYIVRSLVEAMGGTIAATSELGAGATFTVTLPLEGPSE
ncbi:MAG: PAS domain-containing sensor histidine kinase, partial [Acidimicrobiales bacterium]